MTNPLQWDQWVMTHTLHCADPNVDVAGQVHWSWFFLPWHRAYLWFLERHLAYVLTSVLGEDGSKFALPYWDWINHREIPNTRERALRGIPSPLFGYDLSKEDMVNSDQLGFDNLALWDGHRKPTIQQPTMDPGNELSKDSRDHIEETLTFMSPESIRFMLLLDFEDFAGRAVPTGSKIPSSGMGILEHYPHNNGHDWVGSRFGINRDMGTLRYAALDPIFFMHHANIDRIWSLYRRDQPDPDKQWGPNKYVWGAQSYVFVDTDGAPVTVNVSDIIKCMTNVTYVEPLGEVAIAPVASTLQAPAPRPAAANTLSLAQQVSTLTTKPLTITASAPLALRTLMVVPGRENSRPLSLLTIQTGPIAYPGKFTIRVFVDKPEADRETSIHDSHYIGRIRALDSDGRSGESGTDVTHTFSVLILPSNTNFYNLVTPGASFTVTLVPLGPRQEDESFRIEIRDIQLKIVE